MDCFKEISGTFLFKTSILRFYCIILQEFVVFDDDFDNDYCNKNMTKDLFENSSELLLES